MRVVIDEFTLTYPGIKNVEREYFSAVHGADDATRRTTWRRRMPWVASSERRRTGVNQYIDTDGVARCQAIAQQVAARVEGMVDSAV